MELYHGNKYWVLDDRALLPYYHKVLSCNKVTSWTADIGHRKDYLLKVKTTAGLFFIYEPDSHKWLFETKESALDAAISLTRKKLDDISAHLQFLQEESKHDGID